jgi:hypothetical protein
MITLGFDASTTTVGFAFTEGKEILDTGFIDISKIVGNREKVWHVIDFLSVHFLIKKVDRINLEAALNGFSGPSSKSVVIMLARFNAVLEYVLADHYKKPVHLVNVNTARKQVFGKSKVKGIKPKEYVKVTLDSMYDMTPWFVYNKIKNVDKRMEDAYDAVVISLYDPEIVTKK